MSRSTILDDRVRDFSHPEFHEGCPSLVDRIGQDGWIERVPQSRLHRHSADATIVDEPIHIRGEVELECAFRSSHSDPAGEAPNRADRPRLFPAAIHNDYPLVSAAALTAIVPILIVYLVFQRRIVMGMTIGAPSRNERTAHGAAHQAASGQGVAGGVISHVKLA
jgi:hypothetical protein